MYTESELAFLSELKASHPDIYDKLLSILIRHDECVRTASHDFRNIITLISGNYQLLALHNPQLLSERHFAQIGSDIDSLTQASIDLKETLKMNPN